MRKFVCLLLCFLISMGIFAGCQNDEAAADPLAGVFSVGYAKVDITPSVSVGLAGFGGTSERMSNLCYLRCFYG